MELYGLWNNCIATICLSLCFCCLSIMAAEREIKVRETAFADMASAVDVLGQQAGIDIVNEKIMIDGIYEATIYLDNRQINDLDQLRRLTASKIDNIKIIISPNAEYGNDICAVVRITLLKITANRLETESQMKIDLSDTPSLNFDQYLLGATKGQP